MNRKLIFFSGAFIGIFCIVYLLRPILLPFFISFLFAYVLDPVVDHFEQRKINRTVGIFILIVSAFSALSLLFFFIYPVLTVQGETLLNKVPVYVVSIKNLVAPLIGRFPADTAQAVESLIDEGINNIGSIPVALLSSVTSYLWKTVSGFAEIIVGCFSLLLIPVATFYLLRDIDGLREKALFLVPLSYRGNVVTVLHEINSVLKNFIQGQLAVSCILAVLYSAGLYFCGTPFWMGIGIAAGISSFIPFLGLLIGIVPALILTFLEYHDAEHIIGVLAVFGAVQILEGMVITPRIIGSKLGLHPLVIIFAVFFGGSVFGFFGVLFAVPAAAVLAVLLKRIIFDKEDIVDDEKKEEFIEGKR